MADTESPAGALLAEPPSKRRRLQGDSQDSTPRYSSPDERDDVSPAPNGKPLPARSLSIRRGRPPTRSRSRSPEDTNGKPRGYYSSSPNSRASRSRSPSSRSRSRSRLRSSPRSDSRSRSRSRSRLRDSRSRSRLDSRSHSRSRSRSRSSPTPSHSPRPGSPSAHARTHHSRRGPPPPPQPAPLRPDYRRRLELRGHEGPISQVRISPDGHWIATASADGTAKVWDAATGAHMETLVGHMAGVSCVAWAPDSNTLATGSDDKSIRLWDRVTASPAHAIASTAGEDRREQAQKGRAVRKRQQQHQANGAGGGAGSARGGPTGKGPLLGHHNYVYCLAFSPKGNILASGSYDEAVFLWDVRAGRLMRSLPAHSDPVSGIDFARDGTLVVSCSTDGLIRVWDTSTGQCLRTLVHEDNPAVANVCFSPNGRFVLAFSLDNCIRLWDYVAGSVKKTYQGHENSGFSIGGSFGTLTEPDDDDSESNKSGDLGDGASRRKRTRAFIASASEDGDIVMWDVKSKEIVQRIDKAHAGVCFWVDVHGDTMVSAGKDGRVVVFRNKGKGGKKNKKNSDDAAEAAVEPTAEPKINGLVNGTTVNGYTKDDSETPHLATADEELQRQVEADAGASTPLKQEHIKEEDEV